MLKRLTLIVLLLIGIAKGEPQDLRIVSTRAYAHGDLDRRIYLEIKVRNNGKTTDRDSLVTMKFQPLAPIGYKASGFEAYYFHESDMEVGELKPGQTRTLVYATPYFAAQDFSQSTGSFPTYVQSPGSGSTQGNVRYWAKVH